MRKTSMRRATRHTLRRAYRGTGVPKKVVVRSSLVVPDDDPNGIVCRACGARVAVLANGRPRAHAAGGVRPSTRQGAYKCEGSGRE